VVGFRSFDLCELSRQQPDHPPGAVVDQTQFRARREAAQTQGTHDAQRWSDDGGRTAGRAVARHPAPH
jgi:hypothetical protein